MDLNFYLIFDILKSVLVPVFISILSFIIFNISKDSFKLIFFISKEYIKLLYSCIIIGTLLFIPFYFFILTYNSFVSPIPIGETHIGYLSVIYIPLVFIIFIIVKDSKKYKQFKKMLPCKNIINYDELSIFFLLFFCISLSFRNVSLIDLNYSIPLIIISYYFIKQSYHSMLYCKNILKNNYYDQLKLKMNFKDNEQGFFVKQNELNSFLIEGIILNVFYCNISIKKLKNLKYDEKQYIFYSEYLLEQLENDNLNFKTTFK